MIKKLLLSLLLSVSSTFTRGQDINLCDSTPEHIWLYCKDPYIGECFDLNTVCFSDREYICRKKWEDLKSYDHRSIKPRCKKRRKVCKVVTCDVSLPPVPNDTFAPTPTPSFINETFSPTGVPTFLNETFSPTSTPSSDTVSPTSIPTSTPSISPTIHTDSPTSSPVTKVPTNSPTFITKVPTSSPTFITKVPTSSPVTKVPTSSPTLRKTDKPTTSEEESSNTEYLLFSLLVVPLIIACLTKPNVCVRWWRIISCWSRRHPGEHDNTEAPPEGDD